MKKIVLIKKKKDKLVLEIGGIELCNIMVSNSANHPQACLCVETDDPNLIITRKEV